MRRREFIVAVGSSAVWPLAAQAQQEAMPTVGFVHARSRAESANLVAAFRRGLVENGYAEGQNIGLELRFADGQFNRLPGIIAELIRFPVKVLVTGGDQTAVAAKRATGSIPIVFSIGGDPVQEQLVSSLNRPGGNATGMTILTTSLGPKRLGLLRELLPSSATVGVLVNPKSILSQKQFQEVEEAGRAINLSVRALWAGSDTEINSAFNDVLMERIAAVLVSADLFFDTRREMLTGWAMAHKIPTMFQFRAYAAAGGLMSYGIDLPSVYRQIGSYTARVLKGEKPAEMPITEPTKFEFVINLKTAKALGLNIPPDILSIADEVID